MPILLRTKDIQVKLLRIAPHSAESYRAIRLVALKSDPLSFGSTYDREVLFPDAEWTLRASSLDGREPHRFSRPQEQ
jgi:hypothetical protein